MAKISSFFSDPSSVFLTAIALRVALLAYGHEQDHRSAVKYTDIDYYVFTDAARNVAWGRSPYLRDTYRYTPILAWLLIPTSWPQSLWFDFGKAIFAASDVVAGWLMYRIFRDNHNMSVDRALKYASIWLLNPMVAQISTRGSSEGLLIVMVMALLWTTLQRRVALAGVLLGLCVHFKIYPFIYAASIFWWLGDVGAFLNPARRTLVVSSALTFICLNTLMLYFYGHDFLQNTYLYHLIRSDHRHNFSPYNMLLYLHSSPVAPSTWKPEAFAFLPQLSISAILLPILLAKKDLPSCMMTQTLAFVAFNKVCTSQYFLWYIAFLPFYLPSSQLLQNGRMGLAALALWVAGQGLWLQQGYKLEFLGVSTFTGLWLASLCFYAINIWILGVMVEDVRRSPANIA